MYKDGPSTQFLTAVRFFIYIEFEKINFEKINLPDTSPLLLANYKRTFDSQQPQPPQHPLYSFPLSVSNSVDSILHTAAASKRIKTDTHANPADHHLYFLNPLIKQNVQVTSSSEVSSFFKLKFNFLNIILN